MFGKKSVETLIVGAGPVGMLSALVLARGGNDVAIIDSAPRICTSSNAALLHPATLQAFDRIGLAHRIIEAGYSVDKVEVYDSVAIKATFDLASLPIAYPYALSLPQSELELILQDELEDAGVHIYWNHRASDFSEEDGQLNVNVDRYSERGTGYAVSHMERVVEKTLHFKTRTLIAADGYNSILRHIAKAELAPLGEEQVFTLFEFESDRDPHHTMQLSLNDELATVQQPIDTGLARLQFQHKSLHVPPRNREKDRSYLQDKAELPDYLDANHFNDCVKQRVPWRTGYINRLRYRSAIPFCKRYLSSSRSGHVYFLGDSARSFGPLGGVSLNLAVQETELACSVILDAGENIDRRNAELDHLSEAMVQSWRTIARLEELAAADPIADPWVAANRGRILRALPATGVTLERLAHQAHLHFQPVQLAGV